MEKKLKICIIGAGYGGLCMAIKVKTELDCFFTVFESNEQVGGVWCSNTYPGCSCDTSSQLYSFSFEPEYDWSHGCPAQSEIQDYLKTVTKKYGLYENIRFNTKVECLKWMEKEHKWHARILNLKTNTSEQQIFDIVIGATGKIRYPNVPEEYLDFNGPVMHTAKWDPTVPLEGKRVAVIGSQASAVQLTAAIAEKVEKLTLFQRDAPHVIPRFWQWKHSSLLRWTLRTFPFLRFILRIFWFFAFDLLLIPATVHGSFMNKFVNCYATWHRKRVIKDPGLLEKVTPKSPLLCKRIVPHESYYEALNRANVEVITERIQSISGRVLKTGSEQFEVDVLVLATGFKTVEFFAPMKIYGRDGIDVFKLWRENRPCGFLGMVYTEMPNLFNVMGPYTEIGGGSNVFNAECQADWVLRAVKLLIKKGANSIVVRKQEVEKFMEENDAGIEKTVWKIGNCPSAWYFDKEMRNVMLWKGSQVGFWKLCRRFSPEMFEFDYNR